MLAAAFAALLSLAPPDGPIDGHGGDRTGLGLIVPEGFAVERAAGPALVRRPILAAFDERGRLYVVESPAARRPGFPPDDEGTWLIARLSDEDGDGVFDRRSAYADLNRRPGGLMWLDGSLYLASPPSVWKLTDADDDGTVDHREVIARVVTPDSGDHLHGPFLGLGGRIYWAHRSLGGPSNVGARPPERTGRILRMKLDGSEIEQAPAAARADPVSIAFTCNGEPIVASPSHEVGAIYAIDAGRWEGRDADLPPRRRPGIERDGLIELIRTPAVPAALTMAGRPVTDDAGESAYVCYPTLHRVDRIAIAGAGSTYSAQEEGLVAGPGGRSHFHPTGAVEDADGSPIVLDPRRGTGCCAEEGPGGVYRAHRLEGEAVPDPRGLRIGWPHAGPKDLAPLLCDDRPAVCERAAGTLARMGREVAPALVEMGLRLRSAEGRVAAVWASARIGAPEAHAVARVCLCDAQGTVRRAAAYVAGLTRDREAVPQLLPMLTFDSYRDRRAAATALARIGDPSAIPHLTRALDDPVTRDTFLRGSMTHTLDLLDAREGGPQR